MYEMIGGIRSRLKTFQGRTTDLISRINNPTRRSCNPVVVMFHDVTPRATWDLGPWQYAVTPENLEKKLIKLGKQRTIISIEDLTAWLTEGELLPERPAVVTFDDGYQSFLNEVLPILKRHNIFSTIYISTSLANRESKSPFEQRLAYAIESTDYISVSLEQISFKSKILDDKDMITAYNHLREAVKDNNTTVQEQLLEEIGEDGAQPAPILNQEQVCNLSKEPLVTIGSHGHEHIPFNSLSSIEQRANIHASKNWLANVLGNTPKHFSFPYGSFNKSALQTVQDAGFKSAVTTCPRPVLPRDWNHPYTIPRFDGANINIDEI